MKLDRYIGCRTRVQVETNGQGGSVVLTRPLSPYRRRQVKELLERTHGVDARTVKSDGSYRFTFGYSHQPAAQLHAERYLDERFTDDLSAWLGADDVTFEITGSYSNAGQLAIALPDGFPDNRLHGLQQQLEAHLKPLGYEADMLILGHVYITPPGDATDDSYLDIVEDTTNIIRCYLVDHLF